MECFAADPGLSRAVAGGVGGRGSFRCGAMFVRGARAEVRGALGESGQARVSLR